MILFINKIDRLFQHGEVLELDEAFDILKNCIEDINSFLAELRTCYTSSEEAYFNPATNNVIYINNLTKMTKYLCV